MAIDFSWLINALQNIASNISSFFSSIWASTSQIVNTGQGLFSGLANFGGWLYQGLVDAFTRIYNGFVWIADQLRGGIEALGTWLYNGIVWIGSQLFNFGQWLWAGIQGFANQVVNGANYIAVAINSFFIGIWNSIYNFIANFKLSLDTWYSNLIVGIRSKLKQSIQYTITTHIVWGGVNQLRDAKSLRDFIFAPLKMLIAPIPAFVMAEMIDAMIPHTAITPQKVAPDFGALSFTPPTYEPIAPMSPTPTAPTELVVGMGVVGEFKPITIGSYDGIALMQSTPSTEDIIVTNQDQTVETTATVETEAIP